MQVTFDLANREERAAVRGLLDSYDVDHEPTREESADDADESPTAAHAAATAMNPASYAAAAGDGSLAFVNEAVEHFGVETDFTFEELSDRSGIPIGDLK